MKPGPYTWAASVANHLISDILGNLFATAESKLSSLKILEVWDSKINFWAEIEVFLFLI